MAKTQVPGSYIKDDAITTAKIADNTIQAAHLHSSHGITTNNIGEHANNKYYTDARVDTRLAASKSSNFVTTGNIDVDSDTGKLRVGAGADLRISHDGSHSYIQNHTVGHLYIKNFADDKDIHFQSDDGSGGTTSYMYLDGSETSIRFAQNLRIDDGVRARFGASNDLEIYHDSSSQINYIKSTNTSTPIQLQAPSGEIMLKAEPNGSIELFENGSKKFETIPNGVQINLTSSDNSGTPDSYLNLYNGNNGVSTMAGLRFAASTAANTDHWIYQKKLKKQKPM